MISLIPQQTIHQLNLQIYAPYAQLTPWVQCLWSIHSEGEPTSTSGKFYPDGGASITITLSRPEPRISLVLNMRTYEQDIDNKYPVISIRFKPAGLFSLFRLSIPPFADQLLQLELGRDITPPWYFSLRRVVESMPVNSRSQCVAKLQAWLINQQQISQLKDNHTLALVQAVQKSSDPLGELAKKIGIIQRTLERRLKRETGFSPQELVNFGRIQRARDLLCCSQLSLVDVAIQCGYFDQAHFSHSFKQITLETPSSYRKRKLSQIYNI